MNSSKLLPTPNCIVYNSKNLKITKRTYANQLHLRN